MPDTDPKALRALAEACAAGKWTCYASDIEEAEEHAGWAAMARTHEHNGDYDQEETARDDAHNDARYIAAVSPPVLLALLDRLDQAEKDAKFYEEQVLVEVEVGSRFRERAETAERERDEALGRERAAHAACERSDEAHEEIVRAVRKRAERAEDERDVWERTCSELRVQESRIMGALCDARDLPTADMVEDVRTLVRQRDEARAALAVETANANTLAHERDRYARLHSEAEAQIACRNELRYRAKKAEAEVARLRRLEEAARGFFRANACEHERLCRVAEDLTGVPTSEIRCGECRAIAQMSAALKEGSKSDG